MNKEKPTNFIVTITPSVSVNEILDVPYYGKNYDLETSIDPVWFKQIKVVNYYLICTSFLLDFTVKDTVTEVHDCFLPDLLRVLEDLGNKTNRTFNVNTSELIFWYGDNDEHLCSCRVKNNKLIIDSNPNAENLQLKVDINDRLKKSIYVLINAGAMDHYFVRYDTIKSFYKHTIENQKTDIINESDTKRTIDMKTEENTKPVEQVTDQLLEPPKVEQVTDQNLEPPERKYKKIKLDYDDFARC